MLQEATETDLAYAAGLFDGEGCVVIHARSRGSHCVRVWIDNVDPRPIRWLRDRFGGSIGTRTRGDRRPIWTWRAGSVAAHKFLVAVRPFLIIKADQADVALAFRGTIQRSRKPISNELAARREAMRGKLSSLKREAVE